MFSFAHSDSRVLHKADNGIGIFFNPLSTQYLLAFLCTFIFPLHFVFGARIALYSAKVSLLVYTQLWISTLQIVFYMFIFSSFLVFIFLFHLWKKKKKKNKTSFAPLRLCWGKKDPLEGVWVWEGKRRQKCRRLSEPIVGQDLIYVALGDKFNSLRFLFALYCSFLSCNRTTLIPITMNLSDVKTQSPPESVVCSCFCIWDFYIYGPKISTPAYEFIHIFV